MTEAFYLRPMIRVRDVGRSVVYYCEQLGFSKNWDSEDDPLTIAEVERSGTGLMLCSGQMNPRAGRPSVQTLSLHNPTALEELYDELSARGARIAEPPYEVDWQAGTFELVVEDLDGNVLLFWGSTPASELGRAIEADDLERARKLLAHHDDLANTQEGTPPPIHWAIYRDKRRMVELLLDHGAELERRDQDRDATPLDYAIFYARAEIIPLLIARGADATGRLQLALRCAAGEFAAFSDAPSRREYEGILELLRGLGLER